MAGKSEFIKLNEFYVKDDEARRYITQIRNILEYIDNDGIDNPGSAKSDRLDSIEQSIYDLEKYLRLNDDDELEDRLSTLEKQVDEIESEMNENDTATMDRMDNMQEQIDNIHDHSNKPALDIITEELIGTWNNKSDFSGKFNDLSEIPELCKTESWNELKDKPSLHKVSISGDYNDLENKPAGMASEDFVTNAIPKKISAFENDVPYFYGADIIDDETFYELANIFVFMPVEENLTGKNESNEGRPDVDDIITGDGSLMYKEE